MKNATSQITKDQERKKVQADIDAFLKSGGEIASVPKGVGSGFKSTYAPSKAR